MSVDTTGESLDRRPPHDELAEQAVLGAMMLSKDAISDIAAVVNVADFYSVTHQRIFRVLVELAAADAPTDMVAAAAALSEAGHLVQIGGVPYLHTLTETVPTAANGGYYARIVADKAVRRRLVEAGTRIAQLGYGTSEVDTPTAVNLAQQAVYEITDTRGSSDVDAVGDLLQPTLDAIEAAGSDDAFAAAVPTGFTDLDRLLNGLAPGQLVIVAGRPGLGKSTVGIDFVRAAALRHGLPSAVFTLEMSKVEIVMRLLSAEARVPLHVLRSGQLTDDDWSKLARKMADLGDAPIFVDDTASMTLMDIRAKARRLKQKHDLRLLVVDYLQLMTSPRRTESRQQEVSELSRGLKLLGKEIGCPVVAMSQLNRGPEQRTDKRPLLSDLRESGSIEQDADVVILLHRDDYYDKESERAGEADMIVAKHRNGPTDTITVAAQLHLSRFVDMAVI